MSTQTQLSLFKSSNPALARDLKLSEEQTQKFEPLFGKYFKNISFTDLTKQFTKRNLLDFADGCDKFLMQVFANTIEMFLIPMTPDPFESYDSFVPQVVPWLKGDVLKLSGRLHSIRFEGKLSARISVKDIKEKLMDEKIDLTSVKKLSCSANSLFDEDVPFITELAIDMQKCEVVDLSLNRLRGVGELQPILDRAILALLNCKHIKLVNITGNALASVDRKDFFEKLSKELELLRKLIFIPRQWINHGRWEDLVFGVEAKEVVYSVHYRFYNGIFI